MNIQIQILIDSRDLFSLSLLYLNSHRKKKKSGVNRLETERKNLASFDRVSLLVIRSILFLFIIFVSSRAIKKK